MNFTYSMTMKHTFSAGGVVVNPAGLIVMVLQLPGCSWSLPKGHIEEGEDALEAAKREITEESGIHQLEFVADLGEYQRYKLSLDGGDDRSAMKSIHMFLFRTDQIALQPIDAENPEARWVDRSAVAQMLTHPKNAEFFLSIMNTLEELCPSPAV